ncbi:MAG: DnaD domain protein [Clostridia bacterium]|nr:DnaD domain protein [Clostridia bacterium]
MLLGDFIKVYLYILFLSKYNKDVNINDLSKKLSIQYPVIQEALKYWETNGVITKKGTGFIVNNLQELELRKLYKPNVSLSSEDIERNEKNQNKARLVETINNSFFQGIMSPSWYADIDLFFKKYNFDEQVIMALFSYCFQRSALNPGYVRAVAEGWSSNSVHTFSDLEIYFQKNDNLQKAYKTIQKKLGLQRNLSEYEQGYVKKWTVDFGYSLDIIEFALKKTVSKSTINFEYLDKVISDWHIRELKTSDDVQNYLISAKNTAKNKKDLEQKVKYSNFEQRSYANFDNLYANKQS